MRSKLRWWSREHLVFTGSPLDSQLRAEGHRSPIQTSQGAGCIEIAVVGSGAFVTGFRLAGVHRVYPVSGDDLEPTIRKVLEEPQVGILVLHNEDYKRVSRQLRQEMANSVQPVVIPIGKEEETDLRERIKQAVGVDLWKKT